MKWSWGESGSVTADVTAGLLEALEGPPYPDPLAKEVFREDPRWIDGMTAT